MEGIENMAVVELNKNNFNTEVLQSDKPVLIDFWATWCGPCQMQSPVIEQMAEKRNDVKFCKINVDEESELAMKYKIVSIPTLILVDKGEVKKKNIGFTTEQELTEMLDK